MNQVSPWATLDYVTKNMKTNYTYLRIYTGPPKQGLQLSVFFTEKVYLIYNFLI